jgi:hypothetical protein
MTVLFFLLALPVALILWIVFMPVYIKVNTDEDLYTISQVGTVSFSYYPNEMGLIKFRVFGFAINLTGRPIPKEARLPVRKRKKHFAKSVDSWVYLLNGIVRSLYLKRLRCSIDFDDVILNAQLVPVLFFVSRGPLNLNINFRKEYCLDLLIQVRISRMLWTIIRFLTKK